MKGIKLTPEDMARHITETCPFHIGFVRGELSVELYIPHEKDLQKPHTRDECYVVTRGEGRFQMGDEIVPFKAGDFIFVPAGMDHRFLDFGADMETWVIFYGPEGGGRPLK